MSANSCDTVLPQQKQMRKIRPTHRSVSGVYAFRGEIPIQFESILERDFLIRTEFFLNVRDIVPQPVRIPFMAANGQSYTYTPDFLVYYRMGTRVCDNHPKPLLVEVKPTNGWRNNWRKWLPKWKAAWRYAQEAGWEFRIYDELRIRDQVFESIRFLERYKRMQFPIEEGRGIIEKMRHMGNVPFHHVLAHNFTGAYRDRGSAHIWHLLATRRLDCDISRPLNDFSELWVPTDE